MNEFASIQMSFNEMLFLMFLKSSKMVKVILYSYLILKKMNERITDS